MASKCCLTRESKSEEEQGRGRSSHVLLCMCRQVAVRAERNEVQDQSSLIARYQKEVAGLRAHLGRVGSTGIHDPMHPEVRMEVASKPDLIVKCAGTGEHECSRLPHSRSALHMRLPAKQGHVTLHSFQHVPPWHVLTGSCSCPCVGIDSA